ncbi:Cdc23 [Corchorus olitorius]|uniref:Cdc23 n=1 Tax=Corchorus olitorius TaxID=93759 RepID=A0A1R3J3N4_9ROSI|nr:Cdc23 [Corchorus olitorius]
MQREEFTLVPLPLVFVEMMRSLGFEKYKIQPKVSLSLSEMFKCYKDVMRAAEQLVGLDRLIKLTPSNTRFQRGISSIRRTNEITCTGTLPTGVAYVSTPVMEEDEVIHGDLYLLAKSYFDYRKYKRVAHVLRDQTRNKSVFLQCYALYLALGSETVCARGCCVKGILNGIGITFIFWKSLLLSFICMCVYNIFLVHLAFTDEYTGFLLIITDA